MRSHMSPGEFCKMVRDYTYEFVYEVRDHSLEFSEWFRKFGDWIAIQERIYGDDLEAHEPNDTQDKED